MSAERAPTVAVTGLNATDNPGPGVGVLRSLRLGAPPGQRLVGLTYDALDPGAYARDLADDVFLLSYPSSGAEAFLARLRSIQDRAAIDVLIPTLDAELPMIIALAAELQALGIAVCLPSREQLDLRAKTNLGELGRRASVAVPATAVVSSADELGRVHEKVPYPFFVKGPFYGADLASGFDEALAAFHRAMGAWGGPVIVQACVRGEETNLVGLGDGEGGLLGAVAMRKLALTDKGKGWAGVAVRDPELVALAARIVAATRWRGPFEVEALRDESGRHHLIEVNPRFPAWVHLASSAGVNLPRAVVELARGRVPPALGQYEPGKMFVRISWDQIVSIADFERMVTAGEIRRGRRNSSEIALGASVEGDRL
jgi:carbamoyl-phosphate synthase large subunit